MNLRRGRVEDVPRIYDLLTNLAEQGQLLPRSLSELYDVIRDFFIAHPEDGSGSLAGMCALHTCWAGLGEIRSLVVDARFQNQGIGQRLVEACFEEARDIGLKRIFVLTYIPEYFERFDFQYIDKAELPQKIWAACFKCVKFPECGEVAMAREI